MSNSACAHCQRYTVDSVLLLVQMTLCVMTLLNFPPIKMKGKCRTAVSLQVDLEVDVGGEALATDVTELVLGPVGLHMDVQVLGPCRHTHIIH